MQSQLTKLKSMNLMAVKVILFVVVSIFIHLNAAVTVSTANGEETSVTNVLKQLQDDINHCKSQEKVVSELVANNEKQQAELEELKTYKSEGSKQHQQQQAQINTLLEQNSELTNQLTHFFVVNSQKKESNKTEINSLSNADEHVPSVTLQMDATGGVAYIRWGRTVCNGVATVLYDGYAASSKSAGTTGIGGGAELLCVHRTPEWGTVSSTNLGYSPLVGVEYEFSSTPFSTTNNNAASLSGNDMPCVMCHVQARSFQIMIPGRKTCPSGWTLEYWGYLVSSHYSQYKGSFTCLDSAPETVPGGLTGTDSNSVYAVESTCTALYCPPYVLGYEVSCVVCTK